MRFVETQTAPKILYYVYPLLCQYEVKSKKGYVKLKNLGRFSLSRQCGSHRSSDQISKES